MEMTLPEAIKCNTPEEADQIRQLLHRQGRKWASGDPYTETFYSEEDFPIVHYPYRGTWDRIDRCYGAQTTPALEVLKQQTAIPQSDPVNSPSHYTQGKIEVIDFIEDQGFNYHLGQVIKYVSRAGKKNPDKYLEDLKKAAWYLNREIEKS